MKLTPFPFQIIFDWYEKNGRHHLPWRQEQSPYHVWISEIFLQQTQVSRVIKYFEKVRHRFPNIKTLAQSNYEIFFPYYEGLGYYSRARNMLKTAQIITEQYKGIFPKNYHELIKLPGIGPYTAQAILAFGYQQNILAFDTNIEKIFARYYLGSRFIKLNKEHKAEIQKQFQEYCRFYSHKPKHGGRYINAALMDFSSLLDINNKNHINWEQYPLKNSKFFQEKGKNEEKPQKKGKKISKKDANILVFIHKNHKQYYSADPDNFQPFLLEKTSLEHRHYIKEYFKTQFGLSLSVRPPFKKSISPKGKYFSYHAQIQAGEHHFGIFSKKEKDEWDSLYPSQ